MNSVLQLAAAAIWLYILVLILRMIIGLISAFARDWQPRGVVAVLVESIFMLTDPPLRALRRIIPPLRIGSVSLDLAFLVLIIGLQLLLRLLTGI